MALADTLLALIAGGTTGYAQEQDVKSERTERVNERKAGIKERQRSQKSEQNFRRGAEERDVERAGIAEEVRQGERSADIQRDEAKQAETKREFDVSTGLQQQQINALKDKETLQLQLQGMQNVINELRAGKVPDIAERKEKFVSDAYLKLLSGDFSSKELAERKVLIGDLANAMFGEEDGKSTGDPKVDAALRAAKSLTRGMGGSDSSFKGIAPGPMSGLNGKRFVGEPGPLGIPSHELELFGIGTGIANPADHLIQGLILQATKNAANVTARTVGKKNKKKEPKIKTVK